MAIICISRGTFSGGETLAKRVAQRLGYECLGREVVLEAATRYGIPVDLLSSEVERLPSFMERLYGQRNRYLDFVRATLLEHARDGNLVYHGHAGHLLLSGVSHVLRVRVIAEPEFRIRSAMEQQKLTRDDAVSYIGSMDRQRQRWTRFLYDVDWRDPALYDVVINLGRMTIDDGCETLAAMGEMESFRPTPASLESMADLALGGHVWAVLSSTPETQASDLRVTAEGGVLTISGCTHFPSVYAAIPQVAGQVRGVKEIRNEVRETSKSYP